ncbi:hypothetical protein NDU88_003996 [Pleurodeles waltl]|uniref:Uncharacterized protein n=1 Tax=Pleurodeles waltl TaxID=8319 RepID=A0AAV7UI24_PLEWA|nr:hypothetical protein NDU88_003996 [Pleurodeles waltl]
MSSRPGRPSHGLSPAPFRSLAASTPSLGQRGTAAALYTLRCLARLFTTVARTVRLRAGVGPHHYSPPRPLPFFSAVGPAPQGHRDPAPLKRVLSLASTGGAVPDSKRLNAAPQDQDQAQTRPGSSAPTPALELPSSSARRSSWAEPWAPPNTCPGPLPAGYIPPFQNGHCNSGNQQYQERVQHAQEVAC